MRWQFITATALALSAGAGCMSRWHPIPPPPAHAVAPLPRCCYDHVHVFLVHGLDPFDYANIAGLKEYCHALGFHNTHYGQMFHSTQLLGEIRRVHCVDPQARIVLIGFSFGANNAQRMATTLGEKDGVHVDLMVYMGGNTLENLPQHRPENVGKLIHILATGYVWKGYDIDGAENHKLLDAWHFGSPSHPHTLGVLAHELAAVAGRVPVVEPVTENKHAGPTPRPIVKHTAQKRDAWDFLKPAHQLAPPGPAPTTESAATASSQ